LEARRERVPFNGCQLRLRTLSREVDAEDLSFAAELKLGSLVVPANRDVIQAGEVGGPVQIIQRGWAFRYKRWADGRRQILDFLLPGDIVGLESGLLGMSDHSVRALIEVELCQLDSQRLDDIFRGHVRLALALVKLQSAEARRMDERLAVIGRRSAIERLAFLMLDLYERQRRHGAGGKSCPFPLRRQHMADATGLTGAHINRTLNALRRERVATIEEGALVIRDLPALARLAGRDTGAWNGS
jgi:CRP/FNR family transcriptional regulator, anaerobic regulatory protein